MAPVLTPSQTQTQTHEGGPCTFTCGLLTVKASYFRVKCAFVTCVCKQTVTSCQGSVFVFMDAHSVTSACLFMHVGENNTWGYLESAVLINLSPLCHKPSTLSFYRVFTLRQAEWTCNTLNALTDKTLCLFWSFSKKNKEVLKILKLQSTADKWNLKTLCLPAFKSL